MRFPAPLLVPILPFTLMAPSASSLPDTGQDLCYDGTAIVACTNANTGDTATYPRQDGRFGRDAKATAGTLVKVGGAAGFDYSKIANDGSDLGAGVGLVLGTNPGDWACTRDNITGLTWEVKTATSTDLRYSGHTYTWFSNNTDNAATNGGNQGSTGGNTCSDTLPSSLCNTEAFITAVNAVNVTGLCRYSNWRLPNLRELSTLVHFGAQNPSIDTTYFPNTVALGFWSASSYVRGPTDAWYVGFSDGGSSFYGKAVDVYVRLVSGGQF